MANGWRSGRVTAKMAATACFREAHQAVVHLLRTFLAMAAEHMKVLRAETAAFTWQLRRRARDGNTIILFEISRRWTLG